MWQRFVFSFLLSSLLFSSFLYALIFALNNMRNPVRRRPPCICRLHIHAPLSNASIPSSIDAFVYECTKQSHLCSFDAFFSSLLFSRSRLTIVKLVRRNQSHLHFHRVIKHSSSNISFSLSRRIFFFSSWLTRFPLSWLRSFDNDTCRTNVCLCLVTATSSR